jgi:hypothetical protein
MAEPKKDFGGFFEAGYGSYRKVLARGSLDVPFGEAFGAKVSAYVQNDRGYVRNTTNGERLNGRPTALGAGWASAHGSAIQSAGPARRCGSSARATMSSTSTAIHDNPANCDGRFATTGLSEKYSAGRFVGFTGKKASFGLGQEGSQATSSSPSSTSGLAAGWTWRSSPASWG